MSRPAARLLGRALRREPGRLIRIGFWSVVEAAPAFLIGHAIARAIEDGFARSRPGIGLIWLAVLGGVWVVAAIGARQVVLAVAAVVEPFRDRLLTWVVATTLHRPAASRLPPDTAAVARSNLQVELARDAFAAVITVVRSFVFTVVGVVVGLATLMPQVLVLVVPPFAAGLALFLFSLPALARRQRAFILADEATAETVTTMVGGLRDIAACGAEDRLRAVADRQVAKQADAARALARVTAIRTVSLGLGGWLPVVLVLLGTPWLVRGGAGAGVVVGALAYVTQSLTPALRGLVEGLGVSGVRLTVALDRILESARATGDAPREPAGTLPAPEAAVELGGVTFAYGPHAEPVIAGLDLVVPAGDHLAVVGPSGIGKSTLAALITGMLEPAEGTVRIGKVPADRLAPAARVLIPQEAYVFRGSVWDNLTYLGQAPGRTLREAVEAVGMRDLLERVGGYSAILDPGALSAGERQLVALTRAYLSPARLTILDEATCHLDPAAEARAEEAFVRRGGTLIVIAHRITSALRARRVLLMDGTRVHLGTHDELLGTAPLYADLVGHWRPPDRDHEPEFAP
ncbi:ATP-binding cassette domain-containing protein [Actinomadura scrupuli]|uniref:ATP-binding cassette domain-containing protein n=1 Tax=Actinomadura scrupuli TaxID=559629 RepID=UPI003D955EFA